MKHLAGCVFFLLAFALSPACAQSTADDQYVIIYSLMQQADSFASSGQPNRALAEYVDVQGELQKLHDIYPDWNPKIINFRLNYLAEKIAEVTAQIPVTNAPPQTVIATNSSPVVSATTFSDANLTAQLNSLSAQVQSLQADNTTLEAKLKEALEAQPAVIDSRELTKAQEQIRSLMKENDLLKVALSQGSKEKVAVLETNELAQVQAALAEADQKLAEQMERVNKLTLENQSLQARVQSLLASPDATEALREENALLKKQLAELQASAPTNSPETAQLNSDVADARRQIVVLKSQVEVGALEKAALEGRIRQLQASSVAPVTNVLSQVANEARIRELTQERDNLLAKLGAANKEIYGGKKQGAVSQINGLTDEVNTLRARLTVDEAQTVPYTPEEMAVFASSAPQLANRDAEKKSIQELPSGSAQLVAEAQHYFAARQYDRAEDDYQKILQHDENNGLVLANLAAIELEQGKLDDAEKHIRAAVAQSPDDAYNLSILGYLKFRQEKYDDALDALSRAAKLDPQNPEIQNYLGVTLGHKGLRLQAETALRKALQLDPDYAAAHNNLAVVYISQQPPLLQLARWHYQKALDAGQPRNPDLEKMLADKGAPVNPP
jgi:tetratricopeptide (TPR) repeat protein